jgi:hypothetical protein
MVAKLAPSYWCMLWPTRARMPDVTYNQKDGTEAYNNPTIHNCLSEYTAMAK